MPSKQCRLSLEFGEFSRLRPDRIDEIRKAAKVAAKAYKDGDKRLWLDILSNANHTLSKHERGMFSAFAIEEANI